MCINAPTRSDYLLDATFGGKRDGFAEPEIDELEVACLGDEEVFWLEIAVGDALIVHVLQCQQYHC